MIQNSYNGDQQNLIRKFLAEFLKLNYECSTSVFGNKNHYILWCNTDTNFSNSLVLRTLRRHKIPGETIVDYPLDSNTLRAYTISASIYYKQTFCRCRGYPQRGNYWSDLSLIIGNWATCISFESENRGLKSYRLRSISAGRCVMYVRIFTVW